MPAQSYQPQDADIDIGRLFSAIWRDKFRILAGAAVLTVAAGLGLSLLEPTYKSDARVLVEVNETAFTRPASDTVTADLPVDQENVASQVEIMTSSDLLLKVADELKLGENEEFDETINPSTIKQYLIAFGLVADPEELGKEQRILRNMREKLDVYPVKDSRVIVVEFQSADRDTAAEVPNELVKQYLALESSTQLNNTGDAADYLATEISALQESLREAEARVADFRAANGLFETGNQNVLATSQLSELSTELSRVRAARASVEARVQTMELALNSGSALDSLPDVINDPLISRLREQQIRLDGNIADLETTLLPAHPKLKALRSQRDDLDTRIRQHADRILEGLRNEATFARDRETEVTRELNQLKAASAESGSSEVQLKELEREAASQRALLETYLIRYREAQSRGEGQFAPANARQISKALPPIDAAFPKMKSLLAAIFAGSTILMMLFTLLGELFSGRAVVPARASGKEPSFGANPVAHAVEAPIAVADIDPIEEATPEPVANDNFSVETLANRLVERGAGRVIVVSPEGDAGSTCSVGIVRNMADKGLRTILIDLTGSGASSQHMLSDFGVAGITDLLASEASYSDVIHCDAATRAHVIPTGNADPARAMRAIERLPIILEALSSAYDVTVIDCGVANASALKRLSNADTEVVMAVMEGHTEHVLDMARDLVDGGYDDVLIVTPDPLEGPVDPGPGRLRASR